MTHSWPAISELIPHAGGMSLLERVVEHEAARTLCSVEVERSHLFADADGSVPSWLGIEYVAQCAAVHGGLVARERGESPQPGLLLGSRRFELRTTRFAAMRPLHVEVRHHWGESGLVAFDGTIRYASGGECLAQGRLNLYIVGDWSELGGTR